LGRWWWLAASALAATLSLTSSCASSGSRTADRPDARPSHAQCGITIGGDLAGLATIDDVLRHADVVVDGTIHEERAAAWGPEPLPEAGGSPSIESYYLVEVARVLRGQPSTPLVVRQLGGTVDGCTQRLELAAPIRVGQRVLLFLHTPSERSLGVTYAITGLTQGYWVIAADETVQIAVPHLAGYHGQPLAVIEQAIAQSPIPTRVVVPIPLDATPTPTSWK
jgi:hypothetical protein